VEGRGLWQKIELIGFIKEVGRPTFAQSMKIEVSRDMANGLWLVACGKKLSLLGLISLFQIIFDIKLKNLKNC
jgi:hypothetical protein